MYILRATIKTALIKTSVLAICFCVLHQYKQMQYLYKSTTAAIISISQITPPFSNSSSKYVAVKELIPEGTSSNASIISDIPERMLSTFMSLQRNETMTVPVWDPIDKTKLLSGGICHHPVMPPKIGKKGNTGRCCIGANSAGAEQFYNGIKNCPHNITVYDRVQRLAIDELDAYPVEYESDSQRNKIILNCDVCQIIHIVASFKKKRIAIVGDSLQSQLNTGLECELSRRGFNISEWRMTPWPEKPSVPGQAPWKYGVKGQECTNVTLPPWMTVLDPSRDLSISHHVEICFFKHYRPHIDMEQHRKIAAMSDIMLINYGLHYLPDQYRSFRASLEALFLEFKTNVTDCTLIYRETSAQHFNNVGGDFSWKLNVKNQSCVPNTDTTYQHGWHPRRNVLHQAANSQNISVVDVYGNRQQHNINQPSEEALQSQNENEIVVLPFYNFSARLYDIHGRGGKDCTHFCYTPFTWYPMWRHLRIAIDRVATRSSI